MVRSQRSFHNYVAVTLSNFSIVHDFWEMIYCGTKFTSPESTLNQTHMPTGILPYKGPLQTIINSLSTNTEKHQDWFLVGLTEASIWDRKFGLFTEVVCIYLLVLFIYWVFPQLNSVENVTVPVECKPSSHLSSL